MSYLKLVLAIALMALVLYFAILNGKETIELRYSPASDGSFTGIPTSLALFGSFLLGALIVALMGMFREVRARAEVRRLRRENRSITEELESLRAEWKQEWESGPDGSKDDGSLLS